MWLILVYYQQASCGMKQNQNAHSCRRVYQTAFNQKPVIAIPCSYRGKRRYRKINAPSWWGNDSISYPDYVL